MMLKMIGKARVHLLQLVILIASYAFAEDVILAINAKKPVALNSDKFLSLTLDPAVLLTGNVLTSSTEKSINMARALAPAYVRLGGSQSNSYSFDRALFPQDRFNDSDFTFSEAQWVLVQQWAGRSGLEVVACIAPRQASSNGEQPSEWDPRNALDLISFSDHMGYNISWQLGYECQTRCDIPATDLGKDVARLRSMLDAFPRYSSSLIAGPDVITYKSRQQQIYLQEYLYATGNSLSAITWHPDLAGIAMDSDGVSLQFDNLAGDRDSLYRVIGRYIARKPLWIAESKPEECKKQFLGALVWARRLGNAARLGVQVIMRQPEASNFFQPTPDYWVSLLHKMLVGREVLDTKVTSGNRTHVHFYCHCTRPSSRYEKGALTIFGLNLTPVKVSVNVKGLKIKTLHKYILMPGHDAGNRMFAETVLLNNKSLNLVNEKELPEISPVISTSGKSTVMKLPSGGIGFWVIPGAKIKSCSGHDEDNNEKVFLKKLTKILEDPDAEEDTGHEEEDESETETESGEEKKHLFRQRKWKRKNRQSDEVDEEERRFKKIDPRKELEKLEKFLRRKDFDDKRNYNFRQRVGLAMYDDSAEKRENTSEDRSIGQVKRNSKNSSGEEIRAKLEEYQTKLKEYESRKKNLAHSDSSRIENFEQISTTSSKQTDNQERSSSRDADTQKAIEALKLISTVENAMKSLDEMDAKTKIDFLNQKQSYDLAQGSADGNSENGEDVLIAELQKSDKIKRMIDPESFTMLYRLLTSDEHRVQKRDTLQQIAENSRNLQEKPANEIRNVYEYVTRNDHVRQKRDLEKLFGDDPLGLRREGLFKRRPKNDDIRERRLERRNRRKDKEEIALKKEFQSPLFDSILHESDENNFYGFPQRKADENFPKGDVFLETGSSDEAKNNDYDYIQDDEETIESGKPKKRLKSKMTKNRKAPEPDDTWLEESNDEFYHAPNEFFENFKTPVVRVNENLKGYGELWEAESLYNGEKTEDDEAVHEDDAATEVIMKDNHPDDEAVKRTKTSSVKKLRKYYDESDVSKIEGGFDHDGIKPQNTKQKPSSKGKSRKKTSDDKKEPIKKKVEQVRAMKEDEEYEDPSSTLFSHSSVEDSDEGGTYPGDSDIIEKTVKKRRIRKVDNLDSILNKEMIHEDVNNTKDCKCRVIRGNSIGNCNKNCESMRNRKKRAVDLRKKETKPLVKEREEESKIIETSPGGQTVNVQTGRDSRTPNISRYQVPQTNPAEQTVKDDRPEELSTEIHVGNYTPEVQTERGNPGDQIIQGLPVSVKVPQAETGIGDSGSLDETARGKRGDIFGKLRANDESYGMKFKVEDKTEPTVKQNFRGSDDELKGVESDLQGATATNEGSATLALDRVPQISYTVEERTQTTQSSQVQAVASTDDKEFLGNVPESSADPKLQIENSKITNEDTSRISRTISADGNPGSSSSAQASNGQSRASSNSSMHSEADSTVESTGVLKPDSKPIDVNQKSFSIDQNLETSATKSESLASKQYNDELVDPKQNPVIDESVQNSQGSHKSLHDTKITSETEQKIEIKNEVQNVSIHASQSEDGHMRSAVPEVSNSKSGKKRAIKTEEKTVDDKTKSKVIESKVTESAKTETKTDPIFAAKTDEVSKAIQAARAEALLVLQKVRESKMAEAMKALDASAKQRSADAAKYVELQKKRAEKLAALKEKLREKRAKILQQYREELLDALSKCDSEVEKNLKRRQIWEDLTKHEDFQDLVDKDKLAYLTMNKPIDYNSPAAESDEADFQSRKYIPEIDLVQPLHEVRERKLNGADDQRQYHEPSPLQFSDFDNLFDDDAHYEDSRNSMKEILEVEGERAHGNNDDRTSYYAIVESMENPKIVHQDFLDDPYLENQYVRAKDYSSLKNSENSIFYKPSSKKYRDGIYGSDHPGYENFQKPHSEFQDAYLSESKYYHKVPTRKQSVKHQEEQGSIYGILEYDPTSAAYENNFVSEFSKPSIGESAITHKQEAVKELNELDYRSERLGTDKGNKKTGKTGIIRQTSKYGNIENPSSSILDHAAKEHSPALELLADESYFDVGEQLKPKLTMAAPEALTTPVQTALGTSLSDVYQELYNDRIMAIPRYDNLGQYHSAPTYKNMNSPSIMDAPYDSTSYRISEHPQTISYSQFDENPSNKDELFNPMETFPSYLKPNTRKPVNIPYEGNIRKSRDLGSHSLQSLEEPSFKVISLVDKNEPSLRSGRVGGKKLSNYMCLKEDSSEASAEDGTLLKLVKENDHYKAIPTEEYKIKTSNGLKRKKCLQPLEFDENIKYRKPKYARSTSAEETDVRSGPSTDHLRRRIPIRQYPDNRRINMYDDGNFLRKHEDILVDLPRRYKNGIEVTLHEDEDGRYHPDDDEVSLDQDETIDANKYELLMLIPVKTHKPNRFRRDAGNEIIRTESNDDTDEVWTDFDETQEEKKTMEEGQKNLNEYLIKMSKIEYPVMKNEFETMVIDDEEDTFDPNETFDANKYMLEFFFPTLPLISRRFRREAGNEINRTEINDSMNEVWSEIVDMTKGEKRLQEYIAEKEREIREFEEAQKNLNKYLMKIRKIEHPVLKKEFEKIINDYGHSDIEDLDLDEETSEERDKIILEEYLKEQMLKTIRQPIEDQNSTAFSSGDDSSKNDDDDSSVLTLVDKAIPKIQDEITGELKRARNLTESLEDFMHDFDDGLNRTVQNEKIDGETENDDSSKQGLMHNIFDTALTSVKKFFHFLSGIAHVFHKH